jgi:ankyrin repeat protein
VDITNSCDQVSYCSIPMLDLEYLKKNKKSHFFYDMSITKENQTIERLRRKYQEYFSAYNSNGLRSPSDLYNILFEVDFNIDNCQGKVVADTSFTYFHWKLAELMQSIPRFNIKKYHPEEIKILALNIFPRGNTVLHYAFKNVHIIQRFYRVIENEVKKQRELSALNEDTDANGVFEIPFLKNFDEKTAIHLCIESLNIKSADIILQKLCNDPLDSHARAINDILPDLVDLMLNSLGNYLDSRFQQTSLLRDMRRGGIRKDGLDYGMITAELWPDKNQFKDRMFDKS